MFHKLLFVVVSILLSAAVAKDLYSNTSPVNKLNSSNFAKRITNNRKKGISIVHFYKANDGSSSQIMKEYEKFTKDNKGMYELGAVN